MDPTKNYTMLIESPVPLSERQRVASELMRIESCVEQVGYISEKSGCDIDLQMAGGEFCGNASMSAAAFFAYSNGISVGDVHLFVSGCEDQISVDVSKYSDGAYKCTVGMPKHRDIIKVCFNGENMPAVVFDGITHLIIENKQIDKNKAESMIPVLCKKLRAEALGMMFTDTERQTLTPLVFVPSAKTMYWENSCASGTAAVGIYYSHLRNKQITLSLLQPGGTLSVKTAPGGTPRLSGDVRFCKKNTITLDSILF